MEVKDLLEVSKRQMFAMQEGMRLAVAIREFTEKMAVKVAAHIGEGDGWAEEENAAEMHEALQAALAEGDYVSVANYSMFLNGLGYKPGRSQ